MSAFSCLIWNVRCFSSYGKLPDVVETSQPAIGSFKLVMTHFLCYNAYCLLKHGPTHWYAALCVHDFIDVLKLTTATALLRCWCIDFIFTHNSLLVLDNVLICPHLKTLAILRLPSEGFFFWYPIISTLHSNDMLYPVAIFNWYPANWDLANNLPASWPPLRTLHIRTYTGSVDYQSPFSCTRQEKAN